MRNFQGIIFKGDFQICISVPLNKQKMRVSPERAEVIDSRITLGVFEVSIDCHRRRRIIYCQNNGVSVVSSGISRFTICYFYPP